MLVADLPRMSESRRLCSVYSSAMSACFRMVCCTWHASRIGGLCLWKRVKSYKSLSYSRARVNECKMELTSTFLARWLQLRVLYILLKASIKTQFFPSLYWFIPCLFGVWRDRECLSIIFVNEGCQWERRTSWHGIKGGVNAPAIVFLYLCLGLVMMYCSS